MKLALTVKNRNSMIGNVDLKKMAARKLGRTGNVLARRQIDQLDPLFEEFKNEL